MRVLALACTLFFLFANSTPAQTPREFRPIPRGELYERDFLSDFFTALGHRPAGLTWVDESETARLLITAGSQAVSGDSENALRTVGLLPDTIAVSFPFLATMREDLLVPAMLAPWYDKSDAREMLFQFYRETWLPHPEYRDDFITFRNDTAGRASRTDTTVPAVYILAHLPEYGFVPDRNLTQDDPYLFLWDLLTGLTYYAQRCTYYGLQYDRYNPNTYKNAVVQKFGQTIKTAYDEAIRIEVGRSFWGSLIDSYHPFTTPTSGTETTGLMTSPSDTRPTDTVPSAQAPDREVTQPMELFRPPDSMTHTQRVNELRTRIDALKDRIYGRIETPPAETVEIPQSETGETPPVTEIPPETPTETEIITPTSEPVEEIPDEFTIEYTPPTPSEALPEEPVSPELGNYALLRLNEIADQLAVDIGALATSLGRETIDLVVLLNDMNVSEETLQNAESRYIAKREAFLAGLGVWDRFNMEIYTPLTLQDFNNLMILNLRTPYEELKNRPVEWRMYSSFEQDFEQAFQRITTGVRNRRDDPDIMAAEAAALTAFMAEYNAIIKEIEDLIAGAVTETAVGEQIE